MLRSSRRFSLVTCLSLGLLGCATGGEVDDDGGFAPTTYAGDGDGDPGDGDGDPTGDGDGDPTGDGDGDPTGDGDGDSGSCGDAVVDADEECDSANNAGETCSSLGYDGGTLLCADDCTFDVSGCETIEAVCGDGIINGTELCDGAELGGQDCVGLGFTGGTLTCAGDCSLDSSGCTNDTIIDLEAGVVPPGFTAGGSAPWSVTTADKWQGSYGARSGSISDAQESWAQVTVQFAAPGTVSFYQRISSESGYDYGSMTIDGGLQGEWSGSGAWTMQSYPVGAGQHTLRWTYDKDASLASGDDAFYVDYIVLSGGVVVL